MDYTEYFLFAGIFLLLAILVFYIFYNFELPRNDSNEASVIEFPSKKRGSLAVCPLCHYIVGPGEQVHAKLISLPDKRKRVEIRGCDRCLYTDKYCPRCKHKLEKNDIVFALLIDRTKREKKAGKKDLLHIEGCINCFKR